MENSLELIGWLGSIAFSICGLPQAYKSYKEGHSEGISWGFLGLWLFGEIATLVYIIPKQHLPLIFNYLGNLLFISVILFYKVKPRK